MDVGNDSIDVIVGYVDRFVIVKRFNGSEEFDIFFGDVGKFEY